MAHVIPLSWPEQFVYLVWQLTFTWLGLIFYLFIIQIFFYAASLVSGIFTKERQYFKSATAACLCALSSIAIVGYGFLEASKPVKTIKYEVISQKVAQNTRLVFLSDLHLGVQKSSARLQNLIELIENKEPDLIIFGGDVVNDHLEWLSDEARQIRNLKVPAGKFGVIGNHEFYPGLQDSLNFLSDAEIKIIDDDMIYIEELNINLIGITDPTPFSPARAHQENITSKLLSSADSGHFNLLVSHRPWGFESAVRYGTELHLAGHTHNGQIFPFRYFVRLQFEYVYGAYREGNSKLIVTSGAGSWGPPIRFMAPAEIVVVDLVRP